MPVAQTDQIADMIEADERRALRDAHREAGGSQRRALKTFVTDREKKERREAHAALLRVAIDELRDEAGAERWLETLALNPSLTPLNAALVALQTPGEIVGTAPQWNRQGYRVAKGERAAGRITGRGFWPLAYFTAEQARAGDLAEFEPPVSTVSAFNLANEFRTRLDAGNPPRMVAADLDPR